MNFKYSLVCVCENDDRALFIHFFEILNNRYQKSIMYFVVFEVANNISLFYLFKIILNDCCHYIVTASFEAFYATFSSQALWFLKAWNVMKKFNNAE